MSVPTLTVQINAESWHWTENRNSYHKITSFSICLDNLMKLELVQNIFNVEKADYM